MYAKVLPSGMFNVQTDCDPMPTVFPLTLAWWPMTSEYYWWTSEFLSYWARLVSGILTIVANDEKEKWNWFFKNKLVYSYVCFGLPFYYIQTITIFTI